MDGVDTLAMAVHGRKARPDDWVDGADGRLYFDAANKIRRLEGELDAINAKLAGAQGNSPQQKAQ